LAARPFPEEATLQAAAVIGPAPTNAAAASAPTRGTTAASRPDAGATPTLT